MRAEAQTAGYSYEIKTLYTLKYKYVCLAGNYTSREQKKQEKRNTILWLFETSFFFNR